MFLSVGGRREADAFASQASRMADLHPRNRHLLSGQPLHLREQHGHPQASLRGDLRVQRRADDDGKDQGSQGSDRAFWLHLPARVRWLTFSPIASARSSPRSSTFASRCSRRPTSRVSSRRRSRPCFASSTGFLSATSSRLPSSTTSSLACVSLSLPRAGSRTHTALQFLEVPEFRNVTLKCLSEIGGLQIGPEYNSKFIILFNMVMTSVNKMVPPATGPFT